MQRLPLGSPSGRAVEPTAANPRRGFHRREAPRGPGRAVAPRGALRRVGGRWASPLKARRLGIETMTRKAAATDDDPEASSSSSSSYVPGGPIQNAVVVITGANRGIGLEMATQILRKSEGNAVVAACRDPAGATELMDLQREVGADRLAVTELDVSEESSVAAWASSLGSTAPVKNAAGRVDVVINNAGTTGTDGYTKWQLEDVTADEMLHVFKINTVGPLIVVQQLLRHGLIGSDATGAGALVGNVTSKVGSVDDNGSGAGYAYRASKSALNIVNKSMSIDLADRDVSCVLLHPGWVRTRMTEGRGLIDAEESAAGLIKAMEGAYGPINGHWYDYKGDEIPW